MIKKAAKKAAKKAVSTGAHLAVKAGMKAGELATRGLKHRHVQKHRAAKVLSKVREKI